MKLSNILLAGVLMIPAVLCAQDAPSAEPTTGLVPGDQITVHFFDFQELLSQPLQGLTVREDGTVHLPYAGDVKVAGLGPDGVERAIEATLRDKGIVKDPTVSVSVLEAKNYMIRVTGEVKTPHSIVVHTPMPLSWVIEQMGGLTGVASPHITLIHSHDQLPQSIEYDAGHPSLAAMNTQVEPGDVVQVSSVGVFFMIGEVNRPGIYSISGAYSLGAPTQSFGLGVVKKMTLLTALTQAGGVTAIAGRSHSMLLRTVNGKREAVTFDVVKLEKGEQADPVLQADDVIYIPSSYWRSQTNNLFSTAIASLSAATLIKNY